MRRRPFLRLGLALVLALCVMAVSGKSPTSVTPAPAAAATAAAPLGFYPGYANVTHLKAIEKWLGRNATHVVQFGDQSTDQFTGSVWGQVVDAGAMQTIAGRVSLVEAIPLAFGANLDASTPAGQAAVRANLTATVNGDNDVLYKVAAKYLRDGGYPDAIIRIGWEFDGDWYPWSSMGNEALWVTAYRHVVDVFRLISPQFRFDWNGSRGYLQNATDAYPGDAYVDSIGLDVYDKGIPVAWSSTTKSWTNPPAAWSWTRSHLVFQRDFAIAHGKQVSYPEWGLTGVTATVTSAVGGDDPTFIQGMVDWLAGLPASGPGSLAFQSYFNSDAKDGHHKIDSTYFPKSTALYRASFGLSGTTTVRLDQNVATTVYGQPTAFTATATDSAAAQSTLGGTMKFSNGNTLLATATVTNGVATFSTSKLAIGARTITAKYTRAIGATPVPSAPVSHQVNRAASAMTVSSTPISTAVYGQKLTITVRVAAVSPATTSPTGPVTLKDVTANVTTTRNLSGGAALFPLTGLALGDHAFTVTYAGSTNFIGSSTNLTRTVIPASSTVTLTSTPSPVAAGVAVKFTATVKCKLPCTAAISGTVTFTEGTTVLAGPVTLSSGVATFTTSSLSKGKHSITATYSGKVGINGAAKTLIKTIA